MFNLLRLYDECFDIIDLKIVEEYQYDYSIEVDSSFIIDIDKNKRIVAFEILDVSKYFDIDKKSFYQAEWNIDVKVTIDVIKIRLSLRVDNVEYINFDKVINKDNVIPGDYKYANSFR